MEETITLLRESYDELQDSARSLEKVKSFIVTERNDYDEIVATVSMSKLSEWIKENIYYYESFSVKNPTRVNYTGK